MGWNRGRARGTSGVAADDRRGRARHRAPVPGDDVVQDRAAEGAAPTPTGSGGGEDAEWSWPPGGPLHPAEGARYTTEEWAPQSVVRHPWVRVGRWTVLYRRQRRWSRPTPALVAAVAASWLLRWGRRRAGRPGPAATVNPVPRERRRRR